MHKLIAVISAVIEENFAVAMKHEKEKNRKVPHSPQQISKLGKRNKSTAFRSGSRKKNGKRKKGGSIFFFFFFFPFFLFSQLPRELALTTAREKKAGI